METGFGWIVIGGIRYAYDVLIHVDGKVSKRKKKVSKELKGSYGHTPLIRKELEFLADENPAIVYIGTGQYGDLPITDEAQELLTHYGAVIRPTPEILPLLEREGRRHVAIIHVTC